MTYPSPQLALDISLGEHSTFDSYYSVGNSLTVEMLRSAALGSGEKQLYMWAPTRRGKTHLLCAACREAGQRGRVATYLPASQLAESTTEVLEGLHNLDLVCIDDLHCIAGDLSWEKALIGLINRVRQATGVIVFAAKAAPTELGLELADLVSRLSWGPVLKLVALAEKHKLEALRQRAHNLGLSLSREAGQYMLAHYHRDLAELFGQLEQLDKASAVAQQRVTVPFIKRVLG